MHQSHPHRRRRPAAAPSNPKAPATCRPNRTLTEQACGAVRRVPGSHCVGGFSTWVACTCMRGGVQMSVIGHVAANIGITATVVPLPLRLPSYMQSSRADVPILLNSTMQLHTKPSQPHNLSAALLHPRKLYISCSQILRAVAVHEPRQRPRFRAWGRGRCARPCVCAICLLQQNKLAIQHARSCVPGECSCWFGRWLGWWQHYSLAVRSSAGLTQDAQLGFHVRRLAEQPAGHFLLQGYCVAAHPGQPQPAPTALRSRAVELQRAEVCHCVAALPAGVV